MLDTILSMQWRSVLRELLVVVSIIIVLQFVLPRSVVKGSSMQPNLEEGQRLAASPIPYLIGDPQRGDIVMMYPVEEDGPNLVKRIIGLPDETVTLSDGQLFIDDVLVQEPYLASVCQSCRNGMWVLGADEYFIVGDNRFTSYDSRNYGPVARHLIMGKVLLRWYPINRWTWFLN